jgi:hypothetical protein
VTTGTRFRAVACVPCLACGAAGVAVRLSGGSAGSACSFGTRSSGAATFGSVSEGSGFGGAETPGCRNSSAIGATYIATRTSRQSPAQAYLARLNRSATKPYGLAAATDA